ncbi:hypothetical protein SCUCBS95973_000228 [Sporothrix curviconia]|uniref:Phenol 2-monooxygenase n=1 Tax=Sporothrix curviconia TaxID=1260050 RepID=A0ABP0ANG9_9PEZI
MAPSETASKTNVLIWADDATAYPVTVTLRHLSEAEATPTQMLSGARDGLFRSNLDPSDDTAIPPRKTHASDAGLSAASAAAEDEEVVQCKYVVGCDGAHNWTRKALGPEFDMVGEMTDYIWGVLDIVPITDFPDICNRTMVHSASNGSLMSEAGVLTARIKPEMIIKAAKKIMSPHNIDYHYCDWYIGQRVGNHFSKLNCVFLAGDAVHTHSPKAGQGMNVSMQDTYNLGWKLGLVCKDILQPSVLSTYELERKAIAKQLNAFDHRFSRLFSGRPAKDILDETGVFMDEFASAYRQSHMFTTSVVCVLGMRFPSHQVLRYADARIWQLHHKMPSDGRFRLVVFGGEPSSPQVDRVNKLGAWLVDTLLPQLPTITLMPGTTNLHGGGRPGYALATQKPPSIVDVLLVYASNAQDEGGLGVTGSGIGLFDLHEVYHPFDDKLGHDYDKVFVDRPSHHDGDGKAYESYGIYRTVGALVGVRPDGYVGLVASLDETGWSEVSEWLMGILEPGANQSE